jgi:hypothetical protein
LLSVNQNSLNKKLKDQTLSCFSFSGSLGWKLADLFRLGLWHEAVKMALPVNYFLLYLRHLNNSSCDLVFYVISCSD